MTTIYTIHRAKDHHLVVATGDAAALPALAEETARTWATTGTHRFYVHNGKGVVSAFLTRGGEAHEILRHDYVGFDAQARAARTALGIANDGTVA